MKKKTRNKWILLLPVLLSVLILLTGKWVCTTFAASKPASAPAGKAPAPKPSGSLIVAQHTMGEEGFLPDIGGAPQSGQWEMVYDQLIYIDYNTLKPIPGLAMSWKTSKDKLSVTLNLRKGVPFHDRRGQVVGEVTAQDVKYTVERVIRPISTNTFGKTLREGIKRIEIIDDYTLVFHLNAPNPFFWLNFTTTQNPFLPILCKKYIEAVGDDKATSDPVGSGPYRLVEHRHGDYMKFEAFDEHWRVVPEFKEVTLRIVPEAMATIAMLKTGEIDAAQVADSEVVGLEAAGVRILEWEGNSISFEFGGMLVPEDKRYVKGVSRQDPWADVRVREAMALALNRDAISKAIYFGKARAAKDWADWPGAEDLEPIPYDPKRAKQLLAEAGYKDGFRLKVISNTYGGAPELPKIVEVAVGYWEQIGLKSEIVKMDESSVVTMRKAGKTAGFVYPRRSPSTLDSTYRVEMYRMPDVALYPAFQDDKLTQEAKVLLATQEWEERLAVFKQYTKLERKLWVAIPVVKTGRIWAVSKKVNKEWPPGLQVYQWNYPYIRHAKPLNTWRLFTP